MALAALIPDAKLKILPGGHAFFIEEVPRFNREILRLPRRGEERMRLLAGSPCQFLLGL